MGDLVFRGTVRNRLGDRIEIYRRLHTVLADRLDGLRDGCKLVLLGIAMKTLPVGTAYSVWVGVGAVGTVALGIALLEEPANAPRLISVGLIIAGIIGLKLATPM